MEEKTNAFRVTHLRSPSTASTSIGLPNSTNSMSSCRADEKPSGQSRKSERAESLPQHRRAAATMLLICFQFISQTKQTNVAVTFDIQSDV